MKGAGFGLVGLLICGGIIFWLAWGGPGTGGGTVQTSLEAKRQSEEIANKVSGRDSQGEAVTTAATYETSPKGLVIKSITPGSALERKYGLRVGDLILEAGPLELKSTPGPEETIQLAYARDDKLVVMRGTQKITLPDQRAVGTDAAPTPTTPEATAGEPPAAPPEQRSSPRGQALDVLKKIESH